MDSNDISSIPDKQRRTNIYMDYHQRKDIEELSWSSQSAKYFERMFIKSYYIKSLAYSIVEGPTFCFVFLLSFVFVCFCRVVKHCPRGAVSVRVVLYLRVQQFALYITVING